MYQRGQQSLRVMQEAVEKMHAALHHTTNAMERVTFIFRLPTQDHPPSSSDSAVCAAVSD